MADSLESAATWQPASARLGLLGVLLVAAFAVAGMGMPLGGEGSKFAGSNIPPLLFVGAATLLYFAQGNRLDRRLLLFFAAFNAAALSSFILFLVRFHWEPNYFVLLFQDVEIAFVLLLLWYGSQRELEFRRAVHLGIYAALPVSAYFGLADLSQGLPVFTFGMDDHSHAAVIFCGEAYILLRFFGRPLDRVVALGLFVASLLTLSRLPVFFMPALMIGFVRGSRMAAVAGVLILTASIYVLVVAGDTVSAVFRVLNRVSSVDAISGEDSTSTHFLLLQSALEMKFEDVWTFLCGIGPGNFSKSFTSFLPSAAGKIAALDPKLFADAQQGKAPLHSVVMQSLLDYNIVFFFFFAVLLWRGAAFLVRHRLYLDLTFFGGFLAASSFYSLHNKAYWYLIAGSVAVFLITELRSGAPAADGAGDDRAVLASND